MSFILCLLLFAELLTAATAEAASELESADEPPPGTAIPAEWGLAMRIVVSDEWRMNSEKFVQKSQKRHQVRSITQLYIHCLYITKTLGTIAS